MTEILKEVKEHFTVDTGHTVKEIVEAIERLPGGAKFVSVEEFPGRTFTAAPALQWKFVLPKTAGWE